MDLGTSVGITTGVGFTTSAAEASNMDNESSTTASFYLYESRNSG